MPKLELSEDLQIEERNKKKNDDKKEKPVKDADGKKDDDEEAIVLPVIDPFTIAVQGDNFLYSYLNVAKDHPTPLPFHLFLGLQALGLAVGRNVVLHDDDDVLANMALCLLGPTTAGKSRSARPMINEFINNIESPLSYFNSGTDGIKYISSPGSAQFMIEEFAEKKKITILVNGEELEHEEAVPVTGLVYFNELSVFSAKASNQNSDFKGRVQEFIDGDKVISNGTRTHGKLMAYNSFSSFLTTTQPKSLKKVLSAADIASGLANRFLFPCGTPKPDKKFIGNKVSLDWDIPRKRLEEIREWARTLAKSTGKGFYGIDEWDEEASEKIENFSRETIFPLLNNDESGIFGRLDLHIKRLILLFAINDMSKTIKEIHVDTAIKLFPYLVDCFNIVAGNVIASEMSEVMDKIYKRIEHLEKSGKACVDWLINVNKRIPEDQYNDALRRMLAVGKIHKNASPGRKDGKGGGRTVVYNTFRTSQPQPGQ